MVSEGIRPSGRRGWGSDRDVHEKGKDVSDPLSRRKVDDELEVVVGREVVRRCLFGESVGPSGVGAPVPSCPDRRRSK